MKIKIKVKNKKASHVGFILSFVIFITSVVFLYTILQPNFQMSMEKQNVLDSLTDKVIDNTTIEYTSISVNSQITGNCFNFRNLASIAGISTSLRAKDNSENSFDVYSSGSDIIVDTSSQFLKFIESSSFDAVEIFGDECSPTLLEHDVDYNIGLIRTQENVFSSEIVSLMNSYDSDYGALKSSLGIPATSDFFINFTYQNGTSISSGSLSSSQVNIYSDKKSIQYINEDGLEEKGEIQISVW